MKSLCGGVYKILLVAYNIYLFIQVSCKLLQGFRVFKWNCCSFVGGECRKCRILLCACTGFRCTVITARSLEFVGFLPLVFLEQGVKRVLGDLWHPAIMKVP